MKSITLAVDEKQISEELTDLAMRKYRELGQRMLNEYFAQKNNRGWPHSEADGEGTLFVKGIIDGLLLDDNITAQVRKHVETHWEKIFEEACIEAMRHKARALAFNAEGIKPLRTASAQGA